MDQRIARLARPEGRVDVRIVEATRKAIDGETNRSTGTVARLKREVARILREAHGAEAPPLPSDRTFYRLVSRLSQGKHTFGSARTRRSAAKPPDGPFGSVTASRPGEWIVTTWQNRPHGGLRDPVTPSKALTPNEQYAAMVEIAGYVPVPLSANDYVELLPVSWNVINKDGVRLHNRIPRPGAATSAYAALATSHPGDVYLCHPFLAHSAQSHRGREPRFVAQPPLTPAAPLELQRSDGAYSPAELAVLRALRESAVSPAE